MRLPIAKQSDKRDVAVIFIIVTLVLFYRRPGAFTYPQLWAEDYAIYFYQFEQFGLRSVTMSYGGYLHFLPRIIAAFWGLLHINYLYIPICYSISEFLFTLFITLNIWKTSAYLNIRQRILYAVSFLLLPIGSDIFMNLTNINWIASIYLLNYLFTRYTDYSMQHYYLNLVFIFIISFSGPFSTLLAPLVVLIIISERKQLSFKKLLPLLIILIGGVVQLIYIRFIDRNFYRGVEAVAEKNHLLRLVTNNVSELVFNEGFSASLTPHIFQVIKVLIFGIFVVLFIKGYKKIVNKRKYLLLLYAIIVIISYVKAYWPKESLVLVGNPRYYFLPFVCIFWLLIIAFNEKIKMSLVAIYLVYLSKLPYVTMTLPDKQWSKQIFEYYHGNRKEVEINPEGWHFPLPDKKK